MCGKIDGSDVDVVGFSVETLEGTGARHVIRWPRSDSEKGGCSHHKGPPQSVHETGLGWVALAGLVSRNVIWGGSVGRGTRKDEMGERRMKKGGGRMWMEEMERSEMR